MQEYFMNLIKEFTGNVFYVPTDEHSSGFNSCEITNIDDEEIDTKSPETIFFINEEGLCSELTFAQLMEKYPKFTLSMDLAFHNDFETWERFEKAFNNEITINLIIF